MLGYAIHHLHNPIIHLVYTPKILHNHCLQVLLGHEDVLREIKNNAYANFGRLKRCVMGFVQVVNAENVDAERGLKGPGNCRNNAPFASH